MQDQTLTWSAVGLMAYLEHAQGRPSYIAAPDLLALLSRGARHWHPDDFGDLGDAVDQLIANGYLEPSGGNGHTVAYDLDDQ